MEALKQLIPIFLTVSLGGLVLTVGLNAGKGDLVYVLRRPGLLGRAILAVMIIPPIAAAILVSLLPLEPAVKAGIMLMAVAPVPPLVPGKTLGMGANKSYAYGVYVAMALLTVISVPVVFSLTSQLFGRNDTVTMATVAGIVLTGVLIPLGLGTLIRGFAPGFAAKAAPIVYKVSLVLVLLAFVPILVKIWTPMTQLVGNGTLLAMVVLVLVSLAAGHLLGGPEIIDRGTLATAASVRHPGIAMALASATFGDPHVTAAIFLFLTVGLVVGIGYGIWIKRSVKAQGAAPA